MHSERDVPDCTPRATQGSPSPHSASILRESERVCRRLARRHYENFLVASILLPRRIRQPFYNIYTFCRTADDIADESANQEAAIGGLDEIERSLEATFNGRPPPTGMYPALGSTIATFRLQKKPFLDLLSAFRQDQQVSEYESMGRLLDYCSRSANPVGRMVLQLADVRDDESYALSDEICTGLQLANFWQDVARDLAIGRVYLPADVRARFGVSLEMLRQNSTPRQLRGLLREQCDLTEARFRRGLALAERVPRWLSSDIKLFAHGGLETLNAIRRIDFDVLAIRPKVRKRTQSRLVFAALLGRL